MRRALFAAAVVLLATACDNGPTEPTQTQSLAGTLARSASTTSSLSMRDTGNLRVTGVDFAQVAADGTVTEGGGITFGPGRTVNNECVITGAFGIVKGSVVSLGLNKGDYCLKLTEPTAVPEGASLRYEVRLEVTD